VSIAKFLQPRLVGARFEGSAIPLEVLKDLAVFDEMLVEVAKWKFLQSNQGRKRSPRGFSEGVELKLTGLEDGSARPIISLIIASNLLFPPDQQVYFEQARDSVIQAIHLAEVGGQPTEALPVQSLSYFDRIGRGFRDGEAMEFALPDNGGMARLTRDSRRRLVLASESVKELTEDASVRGGIPEADQDRMTFQLQLVDGRKVLDIPFAAPHLPTVLDGFASYKSGTRVLVEGVGRFNRQRRLLGFETIQHVSILDSLDIRSRLEELQGLEDGWLEGRGIAPKATELEWFADAFEQRLPTDLQLPRLYPTEMGGLQAEWGSDSSDISLEIDLQSRMGFWHLLMLSDGTDASRDLNLDSDEDWKWLASQLTQLLGSGK
jgi:hypothetical protein